MKRVLIVDDHDDLRESLAEMLSDAGYEVNTAANGAQALARLREGAYDLTITDIIMPDSDGLELLNAMMSMGLKIKVIVITGGGRVDAEEYLKIAKSYPLVKGELKKPFTPEQLFETVRSLVG